MAVLDRKELEQSPLSDLHAIASELGIEGFRLLRREKLIDAILGESGGNGAGGDEESAAEERPRRRRSRGGRGRKTEDSAPAKDADADADKSDERDESDSGSESAPADDETAEVRSGVLDILPNGSGFMRPEAFKHSTEDVYVSPAQIRRLELRAGDQIEGPVRAPRRNERHPSLVRVDKVNGSDAEAGEEGRRRFDDLTAVFASQKVSPPDGLDAVPFGRGSRVAVGGPPGSGITSVLRRVVGALSGGDVEVVVVLAGARPEEVTEWRRDSSGVSVAGGGFDRPVDEQAQAAEMAVERGKRAAEQGRHAAIVIDSLDALPPSVARRVFGAARATEEAGTLTVVASTGLAGEPMRLATTRIILEPADGDQPKLAPGSGTLRAELLS
jgi:transcription termination factor Rho